MDRKKLFSVKDEVALHPELEQERQSAEDLPEAPKPEESSWDLYYSSAAFEPGVGEGASPEYRELIRREQARYPDSMLPFLSILSGIVGGLFAVPAVFFCNRSYYIFSFLS